MGRELLSTMGDIQNGFTVASALDYGGAGYLGVYGISKLLIGNLNLPDKMENSLHKKTRVC